MTMENYKFLTQSVCYAEINTEWDISELNLVCIKFCLHIEPKVYILLLKWILLFIAIHLMPVMMVWMRNISVGSGIWALGSHSWYSLRRFNWHDLAGESSMSLRIGFEIKNNFVFSSSVPCMQFPMVINLSLCNYKLNKLFLQSLKIREAAE